MLTEQHQEPGTTLAGVAQVGWALSCARKVASLIPAQGSIPGGGQEAAY